MGFPYLSFNFNRHAVLPSPFHYDQKTLTKLTSTAQAAQSSPQLPSAATFSLLHSPLPFSRTLLTPMHSSTLTALPRTPRSCGLGFVLCVHRLHKLKMLLSASAGIFAVCRNTVSLRSPPLNLAENRSAYSALLEQDWKRGQTALRTRAILI